MIDRQHNQQGYLTTDSYGEAACQADVEIRTSSLKACWMPSHLQRCPTHTLAEQGKECRLQCASAAAITTWQTIPRATRLWVRLQT